MLNSKFKPRIFIATILALSLLLTPLLTGFSYAYTQESSIYQGCALCEASQNIKIGNETCETCLDQETVKIIKEQYGISAEEINGAEANEYVNMINNYKGTKNKLKIDGPSKVVKIEPKNIIQVVGLNKINKNEKKTLIYGYIDGQNGEIISVVSFKWNGLKDSDKATINVYKQNELKHSTTQSIKEIKAKNMRMKKYIHDKVKENQEKLAATSNATEFVYQIAWDWYAFACSLSGAIACSVGCLAFGPALAGTCAYVCNLAWSSGVCS